MLENLKYKVWEANRRLAKSGLAKFDWGSVSYFDRDTKMMVIKPDGIDFDELVPENFTVIDSNGNIIEGDRPSSDWQTHLEIYKNMDVNTVVHSFSEAAMGFAAANRPVPVFSATHARFFKGDIPATRLLTKEEIENGYYSNLGKVITETAKAPDEIPAVIVSGHEPYIWGHTIDEVVKNAAVLEAVAKSAISALTLSPGIPPLSKTLVEFLYKG
ncbi:MAG: class II aldolase/adducin family protein [Eubacteriales bacterium]|nr:class II aldolase/adducin family protein [Eubacteriales bacterium]